MSAPTFASPGCGLRTNFATTPPHKKARDLAQDPFSPSPSSRSSALLQHDFFPKTGTRARDQALRDVGEQHLGRVLALYAQYHNQNARAVWDYAKTRLSGERCNAPGPLSPDGPVRIASPLRADMIFERDRISGCVGPRGGGRSGRSYKIDSGGLKPVDEDQRCRAATGLRPGGDVASRGRERAKPKQSISTDQNAAA
jgi:hypothetical protein